MSDWPVYIQLNLNVENSKKSIQHSKFVNYNLIFDDNLIACTCIRQIIILRYLNKFNFNN